MGLSINKKVWQYMLITAALLFIAVAFLFYVKPVFIALVTGILAITLLSKIIDIFLKVTKNCSSAKRKIIVLAGSASIILTILILVFAGTVNLMINVRSSLDSLDNFTNRYNETADDMAEDLSNITFEKNQFVVSDNISENESEREYSKDAAGPPPVSEINETAGISIYTYDLSAANFIRTVLTSGGGIMEITAETLSFIGTTLFACCLILPIMTGYYFKEKGNMRKKFIVLIPDKYKEAAGTAIQDVAEDMGTYTLMKMLEAVVIIFCYCAGFYIIGIPHWFFAGILMGLFNIVPYIGFLLPAIPVTVYSYTLGTEVMLSVIGIIVVIQLFDYFFVLPNIVMKTVKVRSFTAVILALAGFKLFGVFGLIFAVPLYIFCKIILTACYKILVSMYPDPIDQEETVLDEG
ncbi:MAG: AI-2E family transporter [Methanosarcinales archaeon]|jgi:predicted PurR-regulated permease PerM|nr:AI-2E family transporter [Methanosarcinales archaeon]